jgi:hypothetical protein
VKAGERRRWGSDARVSVVDLTFAISVVTIPLLAHGRLLNGDGDLARHIVIGKHIIGHGPRFADPFSFTRGGEPFLAYEWLSQVIYALVHAAAGLPGVAALAGILLASAFALVVRFVRRDGGDPWLACVTAAVAVVLTYPHWIARPHLFSFLGLALLLHVLVPGRRTFWLIPLFAVWANLHPGFLYGLIMVGAWAGGLALEDFRAGQRGWRVPATRAAPLAIALVASFLNPFGWSLHAHALSWMGSETVQHVLEFQPLVVVAPDGFFFMLVMGAIIAGLSAHRQWVGWPTLLTFGVAFFGAIAIRRNAPLLALFALPIMARALMPLARELPEWFLGRMRAEFVQSDTPGWRIGFTAAAAIAIVMGVDSRTDRFTLVPGSFSPNVFPAAAIEHAKSAGLQGRLLSEYTWGGYVLYSWPGQRVFVDSMADFFGDDLVRDHRDMAYARPGWAGKLTSHDISLVLFAPDMPLIDVLRDTPGWGVAYENDVAVLLARRIAYDEATENSARAPGI